MFEFIDRDVMIEIGIFISVFIGTLTSWLCIKKLNGCNLSRLGFVKKCLISVASFFIITWFIVPNYLELYHLRIFATSYFLAIGLEKPLGGILQQVAEGKSIKDVFNNMFGGKNAVRTNKRSKKKEN